MSSFIIGLYSSPLFPDRCINASHAVIQQPSILEGASGFWMLWPQCKVLYRLISQPIISWPLDNCLCAVISSPVFLKVHLASKYFGRCIRLYITLYSSPLYPGRCISIYMLLYSSPVFYKLLLASEYFGRCVKHYNRLI